jgi:hypothetical protein
VFLRVRPSSIRPFGRLRPDATGAMLLAGSAKGMAKDVKEEIVSVSE